jgi:hypothetical protein
VDYALNQEWTRRGTTATYFFYPNGAIARMDSFWSDDVQGAWVQRKKTYGTKAALLDSYTQFFSHKDNFQGEEFNELPPPYLRVSDLPFYNLLKQPRPQR